MKRSILLVVIFFVATLKTMAQGQKLIKDPINDFFHLNIEERYTDASVVPWLRKIMCDFEGNGKEEFFLGTLEMWTGDNVQTYSVLYSPEANGFLRLTPPDSDVALDTRFFGPRETTYCGYIKERHAQGVLVLQNDNVTRDPDDPGLPGVPKKYSYRLFYHIKDNKLVVDDLGPLDLETKAGRAFYDEYFDEKVKSRPVKIEQYSMEKLKEMGYSIPSWKTPPQPQSKPIVDQ